MKKIMLYTFLIAVVVVNLLAWLVGIYSELYIGILFRISLIMGITFVAAIFSGALAIIGFLDKEKPNN